MTFFSYSLNGNEVRVDIPTIQVRFQHLNVEPDLHVGGIALPTLTNYMVYMVEVNIIEHCYILSLTESLNAYFPLFFGFCEGIVEVYP